MYCPQCATANSPDVRFCRACGTQLEGVALALRTTSPIKKTIENKGEQTAQELLEKRIEGASSITRGSILLAVSLILGIGLGLFLPRSFDAPWIIIWSVFFGWMAVWGGIEMANGLSAILEAKGRLRLLGLTAREAEIQAAQNELSATRKALQSESELDALQESPVASVTEGTTRHLDD